MPWKETPTMLHRAEFVERAKETGVNLSALCQEYGISRKTGYKWIQRAQDRRVMQNGGCPGVPAASTITAILHRHQKIDPEEANKHHAFTRFEREQPIQLWQMDFQGFFTLQMGGQCHPFSATNASGSGVLFVISR